MARLGQEEYACPCLGARSPTIDFSRGPCLTFEPETLKNNFRPVFTSSPTSRVLVEIVCGLDLA